MEKLPKSEARYVPHANIRLGIIFVINCALLNITHGVPGRPDGGNTYFAGFAKTIRNLRLAAARRSSVRASGPSGSGISPSDKTREKQDRANKLDDGPRFPFPLMSESNYEHANLRSIVRIAISLLRRRANVL